MKNHIPKLPRIFRACMIPQTKNLPLNTFTHLHVAFMRATNARETSNFAPSKIILWSFNSRTAEKR
jgi:hypothetical protein